MISFMVSWPNISIRQDENVRSDGFTNGFYMLQGHRGPSESRQVDRNPRSHIFLHQSELEDAVTLLTAEQKQNESFYLTFSRTFMFVMIENTL